VFILWVSNDLLVMFRIALEEKDALGLIGVLAPFVMPLVFMLEKSAAIQATLATELYEQYLKGSELIEDWVKYIGNLDVSDEVEFGPQFSIQTLTMVIVVLLLMGGSDVIRSRLAASGLFSPLLDLLLTKECTEILLTSAVQLLIRFLNNPYDELDPKAVASAGLDLVTKRYSSRAAIPGGFRIIEMLIRSPLPALQNAGYELFPALTRMLHSHRDNTQLINILSSCLLFMLHTTTDSESPWSENRCQLFFQEQGLPSVLALIHPKYRSRPGLHPMFSRNLTRLLLALTYHEESREAVKIELQKGDNMRHLALILEPDAFQRVPTLMMSIAAATSSVTVAELMARLELTFESAPA